MAFEPQLTTVAVGKKVYGSQPLAMGVIVTTGGLFTITVLLVELVPQALVIESVIV